MNNQKHYYIELHAKGFKHTNKFSGFDSACAHFSTDKPITSPRFHVIMNRAIDKIGGQQVGHGWVDYTVGKLFVRTGWKPVSVMSPAYEYRTSASSDEAIYEEVKQYGNLPFNYLHAVHAARLPPHGVVVSR